MKTSSATVTGRDGQRGYFGNQVICAVRRLLAPVVIGWLCVGGMAAAETALAPSDLAGRWFSKERDLMLDIAQCGLAWCGVQVTNGTSCGGTVLHLDLEDKQNLEGKHNPEVKPTWVSFRGRLELAAPTQPYAVLGALYRSADGAPALRIHGNTGTEVELYRRTFPFSAVFVRAGETACPPGAKTS